MKYQLSFNITLNFTLTDKEFDLLTETLLNNNEYKDRAEVGGFWYGNMGSRKFSKESHPTEEYWHTADSRNAQILVKILEPYAYGWTKHQKDHSLGEQLYTKLLKMIKQGIDFGNALNTHMGEKEVKA